MKKRRYSSSSYSSSSSDSSSSSSDSSSSDSSSSSSSSEEETSTKHLNRKKPKPQENRNTNGKTAVIEQQPPTMIRCENVDMAAAAPADMKVYSDSYVYEIDMPGLKFSSEVKVDIEDDDYLVISGERKREEGVEYSRMERKVGKFMRKFFLPKNANTDAVSAIYQDGVLSVTVQKLPPKKLKKPKTIEVIIA